MVAAVGVVLRRTGAEEAEAGLALGRLEVVRVGDDALRTGVGL